MFSTVKGYNLYCRGILYSSVGGYSEEVSVRFGKSLIHDISKKQELFMSWLENVFGKKVILLSNTLRQLNEICENKHRSVVGGFHPFQR